MWFALSQCMTWPLCAVAGSHGGRVTVQFPLARATRFLQADAFVFDERNFARLEACDCPTGSSRVTERRQRVNITRLSPWPPTRMRTT